MTHLFCGARPASKNKLVPSPAATLAWATPESSRVFGFELSPFGVQPFGLPPTPHLFLDGQTISAWSRAQFREISLVNDAGETAVLRETGLVLQRFRVPARAWANMSVNPDNVPYAMRVAGLLNITKCTPGNQFVGWFLVFGQSTILQYYALERHKSARCRAKRVNPPPQTCGSIRLSTRGSKIQRFLRGRRQRPSLGALSAVGILRFSSRYDARAFDGNKDLVWTANLPFQALRALLGPALARTVLPQIYGAQMEHVRLFRGSVSGRRCGATSTLCWLRSKRRQFCVV